MILYVHMFVCPYVAFGKKRISNEGFFVFRYIRDIQTPFSLCLILPPNIISGIFGFETGLLDFVLQLFFFFIGLGFVFHRLRKHRELIS